MTDITVTLHGGMTERIGTQDDILHQRFYICTRGAEEHVVAVSDLAATNAVMRGDRTVEEMSEEMARMEATRLFAEDAG